MEMGTALRPNLSERNKYWIDRHRYYELKHFCLQYPTWKKIYNSLDGIGKRSIDQPVLSKNEHVSDPTGKCVEKRSYYFDKMKLVEQAAIETDNELADYILKGVTEGLTYDNIKLRLEIPCGKDVYYDRYRRFFWLLDKERR